MYEGGEEWSWATQTAICFWVMMEWKPYIDLNTENFAMVMNQGKVFSYNIDRDNNWIFGDNYPRLPRCPGVNTPDVVRLPLKRRISMLTDR